MPAEKQIILRYAELAMLVSQPGEDNDSVASSEKKTQSLAEMEEIKKTTGMSHEELVAQAAKFLNVSS